VASVAMCWRQKPPNFAFAGSCTLSEYFLSTFLMYLYAVVLAGLIMSECLPVFALSKFQGVTCADMKVETFFSEIIDFRLQHLSYAFLVDSRGRVQIHPLLPRNQQYPAKPIFLDIKSVEISPDISSIEQSMRR